MKQTLQDLTVTAFGVIASLLTAVILFVVEDQLGFAFYSLMLWFVIPVGAILSGFIGASGYYVGARLFGHKPSGLILVNMVAVSIGTFFTIYYLSYVFIEVNGRYIRDLIPFTAYMDFVLQHQSLEFGVRGHSVGSTGELGGWGYATAALQIIGFALGGVAIFGYLSSLPYCEQCKRYLSQKGKQIRYTSDSESLASLVENLINHYSSGEIQQLIDTHAHFGEHKHGKYNHLKSMLEHKYCPGCGINWLGFTVYKLSGDDWKELDEFGFSTFHDGEIQLSD